MPDTPTPPLPASPSATSAFLRGIERRAYVFAQVQCGSERDAEAALGRTIHAFRTLSAVSPLSSWPAGFWSLLLAQPEFSGGNGGVPELVTLGSGPRAALLLRFVGGLDFAHAAQVLGISEDTYRFALQRALQQLADAGVSYAGLRNLRERLHRQVKTLPAERTRVLADLREQAMREPAAVPAARPAPPRPPWLLRALWIAFGLLVLAFAATFLGLGRALPPGETAALPTEPVAPAEPVPVASDVVMHPDYAQLADPEAASVAADLAMLSWLANHPEALAEADAAAAEAAEAATDPDTDDADAGDGAAADPGDGTAADPDNGSDPAVAPAQPETDDDPR